MLLQIAPDPIRLLKKCYRNPTARWGSLDKCRVPNIPPPKTPLPRPFTHLYTNS